VVAFAVRDNIAVMAYCTPAPSERTCYGCTPAFGGTTCGATDCKKGSGCGTTDKGFCENVK
jgi:hypothetical protein